MARQVIATPTAPTARGPYSQAITANGFVYTAGQLAIDPATGQLIEGDVATQTKQVLKNIDAILKAAGSSLGQVVKTTVFLTNMADFAAMNGAYTDFFPENPPARSTVGNVTLALGAVVEIEAVAVIS